MLYSLNLEMGALLTELHRLARRTVHSYTRIKADDRVYAIRYFGRVELPTKFFLLVSEQRRDVL
jgi:hypothetical protein